VVGEVDEADAPLPGAGMSVPEKWDPVRDEPIERLHAPGEPDQDEKRRRLRRAEPHLVLEEEEDRLGRQP
jgi:hypothetical protein